jgi:hypothetical protein
MTAQRLPIRFIAGSKWGENADVLIVGTRLKMTLVLGIWDQNYCDSAHIPLKFLAFSDSCLDPKYLSNFTEADSFHQGKNNG